ncbi:MAG TPA: zinc-binding dehydrogenase [Streptosporangiaceae bacterium]|nr:zinc-binding dehydrogenase [Streptosporangiaceae bacterium]
MRAAGIRQFGGEVEYLELPAPRALRAGEVLIDVRACGMGNWDDIARAGAWDLGVRPPMALGVEAAGLVAAAGDAAGGVRAGDPVTTHSLPLREQGSWAEQFIAAAAHVAPVPAGLPLDVAGALPVPALTADQAVTDALDVQAGQTVLVNGAGGVTGGILVQLAVHLGATVIATASEHSAGHVLAMGAASVVDYHQPDWPEQVRQLAGGGVDAVANAARAGAADAMRAVRDGGRLATITHDPPDAGRGISVHAVEVAPDGARLARLTRLAAEGVVTIDIGGQYPLEQAATALAQVERGARGAAIVLRPAGSSRMAGRPLAQ